MEKIEATFRVVTPMFISSADQQKAELRVPSIKGALRFWWRALAWSRYGELKRIREEEARLFGSTDTGQSQVLLRLKPLDPLEAHLGEQEARSWSPNDWQSYIGYGLVHKQLRPRRQYIKPGFVFSLLASARNRDALQEMKAPLRALGLLGGLGGRSRKGWGSLTLIDLEGADEWRTPQNERDLKRELESLFRSEQSSGPYTGVSIAASFAIGRSYQDALTAHRSLAQTYRDFLKSLGGREKPFREAFGLPRRLQMRGRDFENAKERRASPVLLHIHQFPDNRTVPVIALLPGGFLATQPLPAGGWKRAQRFLDEVQA